MKPGLYARAVQRAAEIAGGPSPLACYLKAELRDVEAWARGARDVPLRAFLKSVDLIVANEARRATSGGSAPSLKAPA